MSEFSNAPGVRPDHASLGGRSFLNGGRPLMPLEGDLVRFHGYLLADESCTDIGRGHATWATLRTVIGESTPRGLR